MIVVFHKKDMREWTGENKSPQSEGTEIFSGNKPQGNTDERKSANYWYEPFFHF